MALDNFINCKLCRKPFQSLGGKVCHHCLAQLDADFVKVRDYLDEHGENVGVSELASKTSVPRAHIMYLIEEKRLVTREPMAGGFVCENCKRPIFSGSICEECRSALSRKLQSSLPKKEAPENPFATDSDRNGSMHVRHADLRRK